MNYNEAIEILGLSPNFKENELKKAYYKKCLVYHPDKNENDTTTMFHKVQEAYELLGKNKNMGESIHDNSYISLLQKFVKIICNKNGWDDVLIINIIRQIFENSKSSFSGSKLNKFSSTFYLDIFRVFENLNNDTILGIFDVIMKYKNIFHIPSHYIQYIQELILSRTSKIKIVSPSIDDLLNDNVYIFQKEDISDNDIEENMKSRDNLLYIPLWHNEVHFDKYIFKIIPDLPDYIHIDDENNLHISINIKKETIFIRKEINIQLTENKCLTIHMEDLFIKEYQQKILKEQGMLKINQDNMFNTKQRSDIIIHIHFI